MSSALRWLWKAAPWLLAAAVLLLLARQARQIAWEDVGASLQSIAPWPLAGAAAAALVSHALVSCFDLIGRRVVRHTLPVRQTVWVAAISYAFNLSFGAILGGMGMRLRLYTRLGLKPAVVAQVIALSMLTNWLGYALLMGGVLMLWPPLLPASWPVSATAVQLGGAFLTALGAAYLLACGFTRRRAYTWRSHRFELPSAGLALVQAAASVTNWLLMSLIIWTLLGGEVSYAKVTASLLLAAMAGVLAHVPAGLGVIEAVFIATLQSDAAPAQLVAALLGYRALYYLLPLLWAVPGYLLMEAGARRMVKPGQGRVEQPRAFEAG